MNVLHTLTATNLYMPLLHDVLAVCNESHSATRAQGLVAYRQDGRLRLDRRTRLNIRDGHRCRAEDNSEIRYVQ